VDLAVPHTVAGDETRTLFSVFAKSKGQANFSKTIRISFPQEIGKNAFPQVSANNKQFREIQRFVMQSENF
jgi:hypothetical protein